MENKDKFEAWATMEFDDKRKYNGFKGFVEGRLFKEDNAFMAEDRAKLARRCEKENERRHKTGDKI